MTNITPENHQLVSTLVECSLGLLSEVTEIEKQMRLLLADMTIAGLGGSKHVMKTSSSNNAQPAQRGSPHWNR